MLLIGCAKQPWWLLCDLCIFTRWWLEGVLVEGNRWVGTRVLQWLRVAPRDAGWGKRSESTAPALPPGVWRVCGDCAYTGFLLS